MANLGDKEIANVLLNEHKLCASSLTNLVLESSNQNLRNDVTTILTRTFQHQKQIFDLMTQKGWYKTQTASPQDVSRVQQEAGGAQTTMSM